MKAITCPVILTSASTRADGSLGLRMATPELTSQDKVALMDVLNLNLKMLLQPLDSDPAELHEVKGEFDRKTPCQRLRGVLYVYHRQIEAGGDFEDWYRKEMERIIDTYKKQLQQP